MGAQLSSQATFVELNPQLMMLPRHNANEWLLGNQRTSTEGGLIGKLVSLSLQDKAGAVFAFLEAFSIGVLAFLVIFLAFLALLKGQSGICPWDFSRLLSNS